MSFFNNLNLTTTLIAINESPEHKTRAEIDAIEAPASGDQYYDTTSGEYLVRGLDDWHIMTYHPGHA